MLMRMSWAGADGWKLSALVVVMATTLLLPSERSVELDFTVGIVTTLVSLTLLLTMERVERGVLLVPSLFTFVRTDPAPGDFYLVALAVALVLRRGLAMPPPSVVIGTLLVLEANLASLTQAPDLQRSIVFTLATLFGFLVGYVAWAIATTDARLIGTGYVASGFLLTVLTLVALVAGPSAEGLWLDAYRVQGPFKDPNVFGAFPLPAIALVLVSMRFGVLRGLAASVLLAIPVVASFSRGSALALGIALLSLLALTLARRDARAAAKTGLCILAALVGAAYVLFIIPPDAFIRERLQEQLYDAARFASQALGLEYFSRNPLSIGLGPGTYETLAGISSHNTYLRLLVENGLLALGGFLLILAVALRSALARNPEGSAWAAALVGFSIGAIFIDTLHWRQLWLALGVGIALGQGTDSPTLESADVPQADRTRMGPVRMTR